MATATLRPTQPTARTAILASADLSFRQRVRDALTGLRWQVREASGGAEALAHLDSAPAETTTADSGSSTSASAGIEQDMSSFFDSLSSLESSPASTPLRQQVLTSATNLAGDFQTASSQLASQQASLDQQTSSLITQVNALTQSLAQLNQQIQSSSPSGDAGTLEDQRQQDLQQLSQLVGIHQIQTEDNGIEITTSNGALLVSGSQSFSLSTAPVTGSLHIFDSEGNDITSSLTSGGGQIGGLLTVRDQDIPQMQTALDTLAYDLGTAVNTQNEAGSDANGNPGVAIFNLPATSTGAASQISVAITDPAQVAAAASGAGSSDDTNLLAMAGLQNQTIIGGVTPRITIPISSPLSAVWYPVSPRRTPRRRRPSRNSRARSDRSPQST